MEYSKTLYLYGTPTDLEVGLPKGMTEGKQFPAVILCHGFSRHRNDGLQVLAETLIFAAAESMRLTNILNIVRQSGPGIWFRQ